MEKKNSRKCACVGKGVGVREREREKRTDRQGEAGRQGQRKTRKVYGFSKRRGNKKGRKPFFFQ